MSFLPCQANQSPKSQSLAKAQATRRMLSRRSLPPTKSRPPAFEGNGAGLPCSEEACTESCPRQGRNGRGIRGKEVVAAARRPFRIVKDTLLILWPISGLARIVQAPENPVPNPPLFGDGDRFRRVRKADMPRPARCTAPRSSASLAGQPEDHSRGTNEKGLPSSGRRTSS
jgi:hypothetical protein